jgi:uncharacterized membrane protein YoaK (UPF0700 family)
VLEALRDTVSTTFERELDRWQLEATTAWRSLLRTISCFAAGAVSGVCALAVTRTPAAVVLAALIGVVVGGPLAWLVRDLVRVIERKADVG